MARCEQCGEPVADVEAVDVVAAGLPGKTGVFHEVCFENYEADFGRREVDVPPGPRWERKAQPGTP